MATADAWLSAVCHNQTTGLSSVQYTKATTEKKRPKNFTSCCKTCLKRLEVGAGGGGGGGRGQKVLFCIYPGVLEIFKKYEKRQNLHATYREGRGQRQKGGLQNSVPHTVERYLKQEETKNYIPHTLGSYLKQEETKNYIPHTLGSYLKQEETKNYIPHTLGSYLKQEETKNYIPHTLGSYLKQEETKHSVSHILQGLLKEKEA